ncbi:MAG: acyl-ACP--UDP-N-acetylglucosamine O-acyltransferase [Verrucomicrobia bacterium CG_4_10_14_3_um_filter_43_23]|nr:MAG: acyl-[acyl-carrier-protein]--UDP-N-acetylglucosamine O-acyltransferase [Verrucomicrobia bacterium CG22_combo_CG10-13_8_21_14_all_43_17]PIX57760.1 MAG: acyl-ACP--UDP-N-acetylglucosamine O-acyltransferase [Verrucomicrobia bacterium CG_4_10_14_3_um_filter_43_23]PIY61074.1 MAG: acyl-ACP--UDP-N-acetylglucosamine O-acyltransferase [Verrucomicrobia bacterium CG_4_10_14_0_8_um_filter_43_34]PJA44228.1 MAG: acyl-ACP--UDP-N-acetylglucosamine O-acyltransferase [Verrucomicrobia bacterium CG_4_9_14_3_
MLLSEETGAIHPTAIISDTAQIGRNTTIGPYCIVEDDVVIGENCTLAANTVIRRGSILGNGISVDSFSVIGGAPQIKDFDVSIRGGVKIGSHVVIREHVTIHRSSVEGGYTSIGEGSMLMAASHVGHDAIVGNQVILANAVLLGGFAQIDDYCFMGGGAGAHQFLRIGEGSIIAGGARMTLDTPPFSMIAERNELAGLNLIGLKRREIPREEIIELKRCFQAVYSTQGNPYEKAKKAKEEGLASTRCAEVFLSFFDQKGKKGIISSLRTG